MGSFFWPCGRWDLSYLTRPGIKPVPPVAEAWSSNHWTSREHLGFGGFLIQLGVGKDGGWWNLGGLLMTLPLGNGGWEGDDRTGGEGGGLKRISQADGGCEQRQSRGSEREWVRGQR